MGIFRALNSAVDAFDNAVTDARVHASVHREARKFAAKVRPGDVVYETADHHMPYADGAGRGGNKPITYARTVDRRGRIGHQDVAGWYLTANNPTHARPHGVQTFDEHNAEHGTAPDPRKAIEQPARLRARAGR